MKAQTQSVQSVKFSAKEIALACAHIEDMWRQLTRNNSEDNGTLIGLPYPYVVPSIDPKGNFVFDEMYYWDSYFICKGLLINGHNELAEGILENLLYLFRRFHIIPNASRFYMTSRSHPPFLTSLIFEIYEKNEKSLEWLRERIEVAEKEYHNVWFSEIHPNARNIYKNYLSRYYDINYLNDLAECESGWDMTTRFYGECLDYIPIDLNCLLYKYETDFAKAYSLFGDSDTSEIWSTKASVRANHVNTELWDTRQGFFFDLNYKTDQHSEVWSLGAYYALWSGLASNAQAEKLVYNLKKFTKTGGLSSTVEESHPDPRDINTQWAYPNGWAPLHSLTIDGLIKYGYKEEAEDIGRRWLKTNLDYFKYFGIFREAYNVVEPLDDPVEGVYPSQVGFGWSNAIFLDFADKFLSPQEKELI